MTAGGYVTIGGTHSTEGGDVAAVDAAMVRRAQHGDRAAFAELVRAHHARLVSAMRALVRDADAAEDVSQDALIEAYRKLPTLQRPESFIAWLFAIARHKALNHLRTAKREVLAPVVEPPADDPPDDCPALREKLDRLPERDREILAARYLQDLSYAEIAGALGLTVNTVRVRCCRARQALRELLSGSDSVVEVEART
ncbi:MAG: sigma-70 family RNA polymerase sigma factor [Armatimonadetes bacterium]|nr:sigma-70 family RNA polymerase sigma factor [Armatimonadota bacterium]